MFYIYIYIIIIRDIYISIIFHIFHACIYRMTLLPLLLKILKIPLLLKILKKRNMLEYISRHAEIWRSRFQYSGRPNDKLVLQSDSRRFPQPFAFLLKHIHQSLRVIEIGGNRSCFPRLGHDEAQRKFYYGAPLSTSLDTTLFIIRGY